MSTTPSLTATLQNLGRDLVSLSKANRNERVARSLGSAVRLPNGNVRIKGDPLVSRWSGIESRSADGTLTFDDWQDIQQALQSILRNDKDSSRYRHFWPLAPYLGSADHSVARLEQRSKAAKQRDMIAQALWQEKIDIIRAGALLFVLDLPGPLSPLHEGLREYLRLPPDLRTHFVDELIVTDLLLGKIGMLSPEQVTDELREEFAHSDVFRLRNIDRFLTVINSDFRYLLREHEMHWLTQYDRMLTLMWESDKPVRLYRVHVNMTTINELDPTGELGDLYLELAGGWLQQKFGSTHVVKNPENTSFQFVGQSPTLVEREMRYFSRDVGMDLFTSPAVSSEKIHGFKPEAVVSEKVLSRDNLYQYAIQTEEDLEAFRAILELDERFSVDDLKAKGIIEARHLLRGASPDFEKAKSNPVLIQTLHALIFRANQEANRLLAAQTTFFEKNQPHLPGGLGRITFTENDLPRVGDPLYPRWQETEQRNAGYVGPGQYHPSAHPHLKELPLHAHPAFHVGSLDIQGLHIQDDPALTPQVNHLLRIFPRLGRISGILSHPIRGNRGRLSDRLMEELDYLFSLPPGAPPDQIAAALVSAQQTAADLREAYRSVYSFSAMDPRYAWTVKKHETFEVKRGGGLQEVESNFHLQEIARFGNQYLLALEYDSLKAYLSNYPVIEDDDREIFFVRDAFFLIADEMNIDSSKIVIIPGKGDHLNISIPHQDREGRPIDPVAYCKKVQTMVRGHYGHQPFHDLKKVKSFKLFLSDPEETLAKEQTRSLANRLSETFELNGETTLHETGASHFVLTIPKTNKREEPLDPRLILDYLNQQGMKMRFSEPPKEENRRLPMWVRREASGEIIDWYYGDRDSRPFHDYVPFERTLTVTMAVTDHKAVRKSENKAEFQQAVKKVDLALDQAKQESLPYKEGFRDAREPVVVLDEGEGSPPPANLDKPAGQPAPGTRNPSSRRGRRASHRGATEFSRLAARSGVARTMRLVR